MGARATFGPVVLLGLAGSGLAAVAGHRQMLQIPNDHLTEIGAASLAGLDFNRVEFPLAGALALVALACWGVLLVTRGVVRRVVAGLALAAAVGIVVVLVVGGFVQADDAAVDLGAQLGATSAAAPPVERTSWFWICLACAVLAAVAAAAAVRLVPAWPEMGSRYDAPTGADPAASAEQVAPEDQSNLDLWKSLDEGTDPTDDGSP